MIKALTRRCLGGADPTAPEVRQRCGTLAGGVGILLNTLLCLGKLGAGLLTGSIAVVADGLNNLSDALVGDHADRLDPRQAPPGRSI